MLVTWEDSCMRSAVWIGQIACLRYTIPQRFNIHYRMSPGCAAVTSTSAYIVKRAHMCGTETAVQLSSNSDTALLPLPILSLLFPHASFPAWSSRPEALHSGQCSKLGNLHIQSWLTNGVLVCSMHVELALHCSAADSAKVQSWLPQIF